MKKTTILSNLLSRMNRGDFGASAKSLRQPVPRSQVLDLVNKYQVSSAPTRVFDTMGLLNSQPVARTVLTTPPRPVAPPFPVAPPTPVEPLKVYADPPLSPPADLPPRPVAPPFPVAPPTPVEPLKVYVDPGISDPVYNPYNIGNFGLSSYQQSGPTAAQLAARDLELTKPGVSNAQWDPLSSSFMFDKAPRPTAQPTGPYYVDPGISPPADLPPRPVAPPFPVAPPTPFEPLKVYVDPPLSPPADLPPLAVALPTRVEPRKVYVNPPEPPATTLPSPQVLDTVPPHPYSDLTPVVRPPAMPPITYPDLAPVVRPPAMPPITYPDLAPIVRPPAMPPLPEPPMATPVSGPTGALNNPALRAMLQGRR